MRGSRISIPAEQSNSFESYFNLTFRAFLRMPELVIVLPISDNSFRLSPDIATPAISTTVELKSTNLLPMYSVE